MISVCFVVEDVVEKFEVTKGMHKVIIASYDVPRQDAGKAI
jgi:hypothetical protein